jgi:surface antigen
MSVAQSDPNTYVYGDCTYGMKLMFPELPGNLGDAKDWINNGTRQGLSVANRAIPGTIVVYGGGNGYSQFGHVAAVQQLDPSNTNRFLVREMNYNTFNGWDMRWSDMHDVLGFLIPPGAGIGEQQQQSVSPCATTSWSVFGGNICLDPVLGGIAVAVGMGIIVAGCVLLVIAILKTPAGREASKAGMALQLPRKPRERVRPTTAERQAASAQRVSVARQRASQNRPRVIPTENIA